MPKLSLLIVLACALSACSMLDHAKDNRGPSEAELAARARANQRELSFDVFPRNDQIAVFEDSAVKQHALTRSRQKVFVYVSNESPKNAPITKQPVSVPLPPPPAAPAPIDANKEYDANLPVTIHFDFGKSQINVDQFAQLKKLARGLENETEIHIIIVGHTDSVGTDQFNMRLGLERAKAVEKFLLNEGVSANKLSIKSKGEREPVATNKSAEGRASNRRVMIEQK